MRKRSNNNEQLWAVIPAAGSGRRMMTGLPKQYLKVAGLTLLEHTLNTLLAHQDIRGVVVVLNSSDDWADGVAGLNNSRVFRALGGVERTHSVLAGLNRLSELASKEDWVLVHDAVRPCLSMSDLTRLIERVTTGGIGGILAQRCSDTIKRVDSEGFIIETFDRSVMWRAQTPQMFRFGDLCFSLEQALEKNLLVTDDAGVMEAAGFPVQIIEGMASNIKVTLPDDLQIVEYHLRTS